MVKEIDHQGKKYYQCEECDLDYLDEKIAVRCEKYCRENHACSLELIKHAVEV